MNKFINIVNYNYIMEGDYMETIQKIALCITIIGALLWGIIGIFDINFKEILSDSMYMMARIIYVIVAICGIINIGILFNHIEK